MKPSESLDAEYIARAAELHLCGGLNPLINKYAQPIHKY
jgi:hypothetical protein